MGYNPLKLGQVCFHRQEEEEEEERVQIVVNFNSIADEYYTEGYIKYPLTQISKIMFRHFCLLWYLNWIFLRATVHFLKFI